MKIAKPSSNITAQAATNEGKASSNPLQLLQRGNQQQFGFNPAQLLKNKPTPVFSGHAAQLKKVTKPAEEGKQQALINDIGALVKRNVLTGKDTVADKADAIWTEAKRVYDVNESKGTELWNKLTNSIAAYKNDVREEGKDKSPKQALLEEARGKRGTMDEKFRASYGHLPSAAPANGSGRIITTVNPTPQNAAHGSGEFYPPYSNKIDLDSHSITAIYNVGVELDENWDVESYGDSAIERGAHVNNSEILWKQYEKIAQEKHKDALDKEVQVANELKAISSITRKGIENAETKVIVYMAHGDDVDWNATKEWTPGEPEANAILYTPNARSSAFMLLDHIDQVEKTLDKIKTGPKGGSLDITFKDF